MISKGRLVESVKELPRTSGGWFGVAWCFWVGLFMSLNSYSASGSPWAWLNLLTWGLGSMFYGSGCFYAGRVDGMNFVSELVWGPDWKYRT